MLGGWRLRSHGGKLQAADANAHQPADFRAQRLALPVGPRYQAVMNRHQKWTFFGLTALWLVALAYFWLWWLKPEHVVTLPGTLLTSSLLFWSTCVPGWFFFFANRAKRPNPDMPLPDGPVAMVVTKAPSEPWAVARATLEHMLDQDFPNPYDVWLADEDPSEETRRWCAEHGVRISCRKGVEGYHNKSFPGREKCKEGNLRYFYDRWGYANYRFVSQLDVDHLPSRSYLSNMIRPFNDPVVGYVAAPSICDTNRADSWMCRARLGTESPLQGLLQAGYSNNWAPNPIGSHYATRTEALRALRHRDHLGHEWVGGLGPELAEDFSTGFAMNAAGWRGAFAIDAIAHGEGAFNFTDGVRQEFQWSRSLVNILLQWSPGYWGRIPWRLRLEYSFCQLWYPLFGTQAMAWYFVPISALLTKSPWVNVSYPDFLLHFAPSFLACAPAVMWIKRQGWLRPVDASPIAWETILFQFIRWPWVLCGMAAALVGFVTRREFSFRVTPKQLSSAPPLPSWVLLPYLFVTLMEAGAALAIWDAESARGYYYLAVWYALEYSIICVVITALHLHEARGRLSMSLPRFMLSPSLAAGLAVLVAVTTIGLRGPTALAIFDSRMTSVGNGGPQDSGGPLVPWVRVWRVLRGARPPQLAMLRSPAAPFDLNSGSLPIGAYDPTGEFSTVNTGLEQWFVRQDNPDLLVEELAHARNRRVVLITIEPYPLLGQETPELQAVVDGQKDNELRQLAGVVALAKPQVVLLRWGHEMELTGTYPWATGQPELYKQAFRHVVESFRAQGADNARWVWSPAGNVETPLYYPGDDVVDYVGISIFGDAGWDAMFGHPPQSFSELLKPKYSVVHQFGKPIIIAELGVSGGPQRQGPWLEAAARDLVTFPGLYAIAYFQGVNPPTKHMPTRPDWRLSREMMAGFVWSLGG